MNAPTIPPPCPDERPHDCAAVDAEPLPLAQQPTARPPRCGCGRPEIAGHACAGCDAPQWVAWPTHAGWWWAEFGNDPKPELVLVNSRLEFAMVGMDRLHTRTSWTSVRGSFMDARLTPPAPPGDR